MPANVKEGEPFEAVATITPAEDGTYMISALDGAAMPSDDVETPEEEVMPNEEMENPEIKLPFENPPM